MLAKEILKYELQRVIYSPHFEGVSYWVWRAVLTLERKVNFIDASHPQGADNPGENVKHTLWQGVEY
jgi:hypothetical protein